MSINWDAVTKETMDYTNRCADRLLNIGEKIKSETQPDVVGVMMDLCAASLTTPIDFEKLLKSDIHDFIHDILGIANHLDRDTGELRNCFLPRSAR